MSTEANFSFTTRIGSDLFTIRGDNFGEFGANINAVLEQAQSVTEKLTAIQAIGAAAPLVNTAAAQPVTAPAPTPPPTPSAWGAPAAPPAQPASGGDIAQHLCKHGQPMKYIAAGVSKKTGNSYPAFYACALPQAQQCDARVSVG